MKETETEGIKVLFLRKFPADLHQRIKVKAAQMGISMKDLIIVLLTDGLRRLK